MLLTVALLALLPLLAFYLYQRLYYHRFQEFANWPQLPTSLIWGHLKQLGVFIDKGEKNRHAGMSVTPKV